MSEYQTTLNNLTNRIQWLRTVNLLLEKDKKKPGEPKTIKDFTAGFKDNFPEDLKELYPQWDKFSLEELEEQVIASNMLMKALWYLKKSNSKFLHLICTDIVGYEVREENT